MLRAYVSPIIAILLSIPPVACTTTSVAAELCQQSLVTIQLTDWADYYVWRGLTSLQDSPTTPPSASELSNPVAILLHWPLTIYYVLSHMLEKSSFNSGLAAYATWIPTLHAIHVSCLFGAVRKYLALAQESSSF
ncbi:hypothetical protein FGIG_11471 [Fasciola gigantica]|uniref:Post-GPI attachment to proteins factor 3 n=1 Tax=Fasciola gigantica TaxID=46835 RepID=A0A504YVQ6_FASGI|nr:hypothetical protein FGIG_11471 [Fasciola gigantica]